MRKTPAAAAWLCREITTAHTYVRVGDDVGVVWAYRPICLFSGKRYVQLDTGDIMLVLDGCRLTPQKGVSLVAQTMAFADQPLRRWLASRPHLLNTVLSGGSIDAQRVKRLWMFLVDLRNARLADDHVEQEVVNVLASCIRRLVGHRQDEVQLDQYQVGEALLNTAIQDNFQNPALSVGMLVNLTGMSPNLMRKLVARSGLSIPARINEVRLNHAADLLRDSDIDPQLIEEVAAASGFSGPNYFTKIFRKKYHLTPGKYRIKALAIARDEPTNRPQAIGKETSCAAANRPVANELSHKETA